MSENGQDGHDGLVKVQVYLKPDLFAFVRDEAARRDLKIGPFLRTWIMDRYHQERASVEAARPHPAPAVVPPPTSPATPATPPAPTPAGGQAD